MDDFVKWQHITFAFLHDIAIAAYIGGALAMEFVLGPAQRSIPPAQAQVMGQRTADRFLWIVWGSLGLIIVTAILRIGRLGMLKDSWPFIEDRLMWDNSYGRTISAILLIWIVLVINGLIITFVLRPRLAGRFGSGVSAQGVAAGQDLKMQAARRVEFITRLDIVLAVVAALLGASLKLGGVL